MFAKLKEMKSEPEGDDAEDTEVEGGESDNASDKEDEEAKGE
jgi:hypothetical protein